MTKKELFEWVKLHHPDINETMLTKLLNRAMDDFCEKTEIIKNASTLTTTSNQRFYNLAKNILKIKELRIDELPIPRLQDTGIIDSTPIYSPFDNSDNENEEDVIPEGDLIQAAHFNNTYKNADGSVPYGAARYITFPKEFFAEVDNTSNMTISFWVKFDESDYNNVGYLFNNSGRDISNGRCDIRFYNNLVLPFQGNILQQTYEHTPTKSFAADFAPKNTNNAYDFYDGETNGVNSFKVGVADARNWSFNTGDGTLETKNKWRLMTLTYNGLAQSEGGGVKLFNNIQIGNKQSSYKKYSAEVSSPYNPANNMEAINRNWFDGLQADGYGQVKPHITSGNYASHGSGGGTHTYTSSQDVQLGCFRYHPLGQVAVQNQPASSIAYGMSDLSFANYNAGDVVFPFSGWMRNLIIANDTYNITQINNLYSLGPDATYDEVSSVGSEIEHFYLLKEDALDSKGTVNGTEQNGLVYTNTINTKSGELE